MRIGVAIAVVTGCASAGQPQPGVEVDAQAQVDACGDDDGDTICNVADTCMGHDDRVDADMDTVADGCDRCPTADDRPDVNMNGTPDCVEIVQRTIDLKAVGTNLWRGWHTNSGGHQSSNDNTLTGVLSPSTYHTYYVFPLTGFTAHSIQGVTLEIQLESYTGDASETFSLWDVTTPATTVENTASDINIFNDLGGGTTYGTQAVTSAQVNQVLTVPLAAAAATDATQKLGQDFVIGMKLDTTPGWIRFGNTGTSAPATTIRIVVRYLP